MSKLYIVPTPIGNMQDITLRAIEVLQSVDFILAEDTRTSSKLLAHLSISRPVFSYHQFNEHQVSSQMVERINGKTVALISDAGTPGISDAGYLLIKMCLEAGIQVQTLPGATAFVPALINSGFPCDRFYFHGFLPHKKGKQKQLEQLSKMPCTVILYESPYRIIATLELITRIYGEHHKVSVSREISKMYEETIRGEVKDVIEILKQKGARGEFVVVVSELL